MRPKLFFFSLFLFLSPLVLAQEYLDLIRNGERSLNKIEAEAERYFKKVGKNNNDYKFYQRWLYTAKIDADENENIISNSDYVNEYQRYNRDRNQSLRVNSIEETAAWQDFGPVRKNSTSGWNPGVGRITSMAFENTNHFIVGSPTGGIWKTTDGGQNWSCLTDNLSNIDVYALAIHPTDSNTYFWGSTEGRVFKSTDGGATWSLINSNNLLGNGQYHQVNKILIKPENTQIMYCSVEFSGIYRSDDGGVNWDKIHTDSATGYDVEFKPKDTNVVYATGSNFFKSIDNGLTFTKLASADSQTNVIGDTNWSQEIVNGGTKWKYSSLYNDFNNPQNPKAGQWLALFEGQSVDDKTELITRPIDLSNSVNATLKFSYLNTSLYGRVDELTIKCRKNTSDSWTNLISYTQGVTEWTDVNLDLSSYHENSNTFQIAFEGVFKFGNGIALDDISVTNSGSNVTRFSNSFEEFNSGPANFSTGAKMIGVSESNENRIYILEENLGVFSGIYVSNNAGETFSKIHHGNKNYFGYSSSADDSDGQAPRDMDITVDPTNADIVYISGILSWRSSDGGNSFTISSQWIPSTAADENIGYCHADIDITELVNGTLFVGSDGGIFKAANPNNITSSYYEDLSEGLGIRQFYKIGVSNSSDEIITGGSQDNGTSVLTGGVWKDWLGADGMETFVDKNNSDVLFGTSQFGILYISKNRGNSYLGFAEPPNKAGSHNGANWIVPFEQDPIVEDKVYVAYNAVFSRTKNSDELFDWSDWSQISQQFNGNIDQFKIAPNNNSRMYLSIDENFYKTSDGGQTDWVQVTLPNNTGNINAIAINKDNANMVALAVSGSNKVIISENSGASWSILKGNLPDFSASAITFYGEDLILGMNYGVFYNDADNRSNWASFSDNLPNVRVTELEVNYALNKVYAATYGRGLWAAQLDPSTLSTDKYVLENIEAYPNPVNDAILLKLPHSLNASIKLYNSSGQIVYYAKKQLLSPNHTIPVNHLASGIYVLRLTSDNHTAALKIVKN